MTLCAVVVLLKKRILAVLNIFNGQVVQSFNYQRYLPIGKLKYSLENLENWSIDEIVVKDIASFKNGPNFEIIEELKNLGLSTPIVYGGGIRNKQDARDVIRLGADRILLGAILHIDPKSVWNISNLIGSQACVGAFPFLIKGDEVQYYDYLGKNSFKDFSHIEEMFANKIVSELLLTDVARQGYLNGFSETILRRFKCSDARLVINGGLAFDDRLSQILSINKVSGAAFGNIFSYKEHAVQVVKNRILKVNILKTPYRKM